MSGIEVAFGIILLGCAALVVTSVVRVFIWGLFGK